MAARMWKDGARRGIAYVENVEIAERVMALCGERGAANPFILAGRNGGKKPVLPPGAMAVYADKKGKPFAWQITFPLRDWEAVTALVGAGTAQAA